jgi:hypothetical protein
MDIQNFFSTTRPQLPRVASVYLKGDTCVSPAYLKQVEVELNRVFDMRPYLRTVETKWGSSWATITGTLAREVLQFVSNHPEIVFRVSFTRGSDEHFLQTMLYQMKFSRSDACGMLTHLRFKRSSPVPLTQEMILEARTGFNLFARKVPPGPLGHQLHDWTEKLIDQADISDELPLVLRPGRCYRR